MFTVYSLALNTQLATYAQKYENSTMLTHSLDHIHHALSIFLTSPHPIKLALYTLCFTISVMPIISSAILSLHYATNHENLWLYHIGVAQTQIQPSPLTHKAPSRLQSYSHLLHILAHQCLPFLTLVPSTWLCKFYYQAYRWMFSYYFHTLISFQVRTIIPRDAENFHHVLHRCIVPWQKISFFCLQTILHSSHVMHTTPKSSHSFGTHEPSLLLGIIFLHQFARLNFIILQIFIMNIIMFRS